MAIQVWATDKPKCKERFLAFCKARGLDQIAVATLLGERRDNGIVRLRMEIAWALRYEGYSLKEIGLAMNRHHTSVLNLLRKSKDGKQI